MTALVAATASSSTAPRALAWDFPLSRGEATQRILLRSDASWREVLRRHIEAAEVLEQAARKVSREHELLKSQHDDLQKRLRDKESETESLRKKVGELSRVPDALKGTLDQVNRQNDGLRRENAVLKSTPRGTGVGVSARPMPFSARGLGARAYPTPRSAMISDGSMSARDGRRLPFTPRATPRGTAILRPPLRGSVASVAWRCGPYVEAIVMVSRATGEPIVYGPPGESEAMLQATESWNDIHSSMQLRRGEFLVEVVGCTGKRPNLAHWLTLITSEEQQATFGEAEMASSSEPSLRLKASPEHEIIGFVMDQSGEIIDIEQQPLPPSRLSQGSGETPRGTARGGPISKIKEVFEAA